MKIYIVTFGQFVMKATTVQSEAENYCREDGSRYMGALDHEFAPDAVDGRTVHRYLSKQTNRWNKSCLIITEMELS